MIGKKLRYLRKCRNLSQSELARLMKVSVKSVKNWEADISDPGLSSFVLILDTFHISADDLLDRTTNDMISLAALKEHDKKKIKCAIQAYIDAEYS